MELDGETQEEILRTVTAQQEHLEEFSFWNNALFFLNHMNQWTPVFFILLFEIFLCILLILPFPVHFEKKLVHSMSRLWKNHPYFRVTSKTIMAIITAFFIDNVRQMYTIHLYHVTPNLHMIGQEDDLNLSLLSSQRNAYLCGFTVYLFLVLVRFQDMSGEIDALEVKLDSIEPGLSKRSRKTVKDSIGYVKDKKNWEKTSRLHRRLHRLHQLYRLHRLHNF